MSISTATTKQPDERVDELVASLPARARAVITESIGEGVTMRADQTKAEWAALPSEGLCAEDVFVQ